MSANTFAQKGWVKFDFDPAVEAWAKAARVAGLSAVADPELAHWHQCQGTWFVGVDALPNDGVGTLPSGVALGGRALDFVRSEFGAIPPLHRAQLSVVYPGYPRAREGESEAAFRYRRDRDAAHVDGIKLIAGVEGRRRTLDEPHAWVLGLPLNHASAHAAPLVVWEGSHVIMRDTFRDALRGIPIQRWMQTDITDAYVAARKLVFETCKRVTITAQPGETYLIHRLALHGVAPWGEGATATAGEGRMIAYFRPEITGSLENWLDWP